MTDTERLAAGMRTLERLYVEQQAKLLARGPSGSTAPTTEYGQSPVCVQQARTARRSAHKEWRSADSVISNATQK